MSQYINLLGPAFRKQHQLLTLDKALIITGLTLMVMTGMLMYKRQQVDGLRMELVSAQGLLKAQNAYTSRLKGDGAAQKGNAGLAAEVQRLEMELKSARESMGVLEGGALGNRSGFSAYLQAFSRQALDGLWLTGFKVSGAGDVEIHGRVTHPELVPEYIQRLNREPALKGRAFSTLELRRPVPAPAASGGNGAAAVPESPRFLEFALTTEDPGAAAKAGGVK